MSPYHNKVDWENLFQKNCFENLEWGRFKEWYRDELKKTEKNEFRGKAQNIWSGKIGFKKSTQENSINRVCWKNWRVPTGIVNYKSWPWKRKNFLTTSKKKQTPHATNWHIDTLNLPEHSVAVIELSHMLFIVVISLTYGDQRVLPAGNVLLSDAVMARHIPRVNPRIVRRLDTARSPQATFKKSVTVGATMEFASIWTLRSVTVSNSGVAQAEEFIGNLELETVACTLNYTRKKNCEI